MDDTYLFTFTPSVFHRTKQTLVQVTNADTCALCTDECPYKITYAHIHPKKGTQSRLSPFAFYCWDETKIILRRKGLFHLTTLSSHSITVRSQGRNTGKEPGSRNRSRTLITGLFLMSCSASFLIQLRTSCSGMALLTVGWAFPCQSLSKKTRSV